MKLGLEVEGRFKGLKTLFVDVSEFVTKSQQIVDAKGLYDIQQVYVSDHGNTLDLNNDPVLNFLVQRNLLVTVEVTAVTQELTNDKIYVMLSLPPDSFKFLRFGDQIKFSDNLHVSAITIENMITTVPNDFSSDINL